MPSPSPPLFQQFSAYGTQVRSNFLTTLSADPSNTNPKEIITAQIVNSGAWPSITWLSDTGQSTPSDFYALGRTGPGYLMRFTGLADFHINLIEKKIECLPFPHSDSATIQHLFLNQVMPRFLSQQGLIILHASAVSINDKAIAFCGKSGSGKSSMAASFCQEKARFLTDDCLRIENQKNSIRAVPSFHGIRLKEDSWHSILKTTGKAKQSAAYSSKRFLSAKHLPFESLSKNEELKAIFHLRQNPFTKREISVTALSKQQAAHILLKNVFRLDYTHHSTLEKEFNQLLELSNKIPVYDLSFPHCWDIYPSLHQTVLETLDLASTTI